MGIYYWNFLKDIFIISLEDSSSILEGVNGYVLSGMFTVSILSLTYYSFIIRTIEEKVFEILISRMRRFTLSFVFMPIIFTFFVAFIIELLETNGRTMRNTFFWIIVIVFISICFIHGKLILNPIYNPREFRKKFFKRYENFLKKDIKKMSVMERIILIDNVTSITKKNPPEDMEELKAVIDALMLVIKFEVDNDLSLAMAKLIDSIPNEEICYSYVFQFISENNLDSIIAFTKFFLISDDYDLSIKHKYLIGVYDRYKEIFFNEQKDDALFYTFLRDIMSDFSKLEVVTNFIKAYKWQRESKDIQCLNALFSVLKMINEMPKKLDSISNEVYGYVDIVNADKEILLRPYTDHPEDDSVIRVMLEVLYLVNMED